MKVGLLTSQWPGARMGGIGAYSYQAAMAWAAAGHEAHVFTFSLPGGGADALVGSANRSKAGEGVGTTKMPGVVVHEVEDLAGRVAGGRCDPKLAAVIQGGGEAMYRWAMAGLLCEAVREAHAAVGLDVVEAPEYEALGLPLVIEPIEGVPMVTHLHSGSAIGRRGNDLATTAGDVAIDALEFAAVVGADAVCAPSEAVVRVTKSFLPLERAVEILPLPFAWDGAREFAGPARDGAVVFVGRLERLKGADILAAALPGFLGRCPGARVEMVGPDTQTGPGGGSMREWMERAIGPEFLERAVFRGQQDKAFVAAALGAASFCVIPSRFENFPYACCEAMGMGRTAIVSAGTGTQEVIGEAGMTFEYENAEGLAERMVELWSDRDLLLRLSRAAYERAQELMSPVATIGRRAAFYERVIAEMRGTAFPGGERLTGRNLGATGLPRSAEDILAQLPERYRGILAAPGRLEVLRAIVAGKIPEHTDAWGSQAPGSPGQRLLAIMERLAGKSGKARVVLYGAGRYTSRLLAEKYLWESAGHAVVGIVDDDPRLAGGMHLGLPVSDRHTLEGRARGGASVPPIILSTDTFQAQFWSNTAGLRLLGVTVVPI